MKQKRILHTVLATAVSAMFAISATAQVAIQEVEFNGSAPGQRLTKIDGTGCVQISGWLGKGDAGGLEADADFFSFHAKKDDLVTADIDFGAGIGDSVDTWIGIFGPGPSFVLKMANDTIPVSQRDEGSTNPADARIGFVKSDGTVVNPFKIDEDGLWTIGVSSGQRPLVTGAIFSTDPTVVKPLTTSSVGDYLLTICGLKQQEVPVQQIKVEVKPGIRKFEAVVNPKAKGVVPVALLGADDFDPFKIDVASLRFGANGVEESLQRCNNNPQDFNGDGHLDRLCHFRNEAAQFDDDHDLGMLTGKMNAEKGGTPFAGNAMLKVIIQKKQE